MQIVGGLDIHRRQITFDYLDERSGQSRRGRIAPADRMLLRRWLEANVSNLPAAFAVEACTGWRFVVEELHRAGIEAHLAEPADTAAARGPKRRAKTDRTDARLLGELLAAGRLPESWIPPEQVLEMRARLQLFKDLREEHTAWVQRIHAILLHQGAPAIVGDLLGGDNRRRLAAGEQLSPAGREAVAAALRILDALDAELVPLRKQIAAFARRQPGCRALQAQYGVGEITAVALWAELGDTRRFSASRKAVRHTGLDITVHSSTESGPAVGSPGRAHRCCAGRCSRRPSAPPARARPTTPTTARSPTASAVTGPRSPSPARSLAGLITPCARSATRHSPRSDRRGPGARISPPRRCPRPAPVSPLPPAFSARAGLKKTSGRTLPGHPIDHHVAGAAPHTHSSAHRDKAGRPRTTPLATPSAATAPGREPPLT